MPLKTCRRITLDDDFYTMYKDCVRELHKYDLRGKKIICPCDNKDGTIRAVHCGWIASIPDTWEENKLLKGEEDE